MVSCRQFSLMSLMYSFVSYTRFVQIETLWFDCFGIPPTDHSVQCRRSIGVGPGQGEFTFLDGSITMVVMFGLVGVGAFRGHHVDDSSLHFGMGGHSKAHGCSFHDARVGPFFVVFGNHGNCIPFLVYDIHGGAYTSAFGADSTVD